MVKIYLPAWRLRGLAVVERVKGWSPLEEAVLLAVVEGAGSGEEVSKRLEVHQRIVTSAIIRLMQFGLIELRLNPDRKFVASDSGRTFVNSDNQFPTHRHAREMGFSFVQEQVGGSIIKTADVRLRFASQRRPTEKHVWVESVFDPSSEQQTGLVRRISDHLERTLHRGEWLHGIENVGTSFEPCHAALELRAFQDGELPDGATPKLEEAISDFLKTERIPRARPDPPPVVECRTFEIALDDDDLLVDSESHLKAFEQIVARARQDVFVLSTFVADHLSPNGREGRERIYSALTDACQRGVRCHLLFGTSKDDGPKNARNLHKLREEIEIRSRTKGRILVHLEPVRSHTKIVAADDGGDGVTAIVGSCNWLSSPFRQMELSLQIVANDAAAEALEYLVTISSGISTSARSIQAMQTLTRAAQRPRGSLGLATKGDSKALTKVTFVTAGEHDALLRRAAHSAKHCFVCASNKAGANLAIGVLNPAEAASANADHVRFYYTTSTGPLTHEHIRRQSSQQEGNIEIVRCKKPVVHAKFLLWDEDDLILTSLNWASQNASGEAPLDEMGIHLTGTGLAARFLDRFESMLDSQKARES